MEKRSIMKFKSSISLICYINQLNLNRYIKMSSKRQVVFLIICLTLLLSPMNSETINPSQEVIIAADSPQLILERQIFVNLGANQFYNYQIYNEDGKIIVSILDQDLNNYTLNYEKQNKLHVRAAYLNQIILQERTNTDTVSFWIVSIIQDQTGYGLDSFAVSSKIDDEEFDFSEGYLLTSIIQYNEPNQFLYVTLQSENDTDIYGIDLNNQTDVLITINYFFLNLDNPQIIAGGNSRVLVQATNDQFWFDTRNVRVDPNADQTIYDKVDISNLTELQIHPGGSEVYQLIDWYFQYISWSSDHFALTGFTYHGYDYDLSAVQGQNSLVSNTKIQVFSDSYNYFIAVGDNDIYLTNVYDSNGDSYTIFSDLMSNIVVNADEQDQIIVDFYQAIWIVFNNKKFYLLSQDKLSIYGTQPDYFTKISQISLDETLTESADLLYTMFEEIESVTSK